MPNSSPKPFKYAVGIDVAKDQFVVRFGTLDADLRTWFSENAKFDNTPAGFVSFLSWVKKKQVTDAPVQFVLEATGVYYEELTYFLTDQHYQVSVLLAYKVKHFAQSTEKKSKTDPEDAELLSRMGLERNLPVWTAATVTMRAMRGLYRELDALKQDSTRLQNRLHAYEHSYKPNLCTITRLKEQLQFLDQHILAINQELTQLVAGDGELKAKMDLLTSIPGVGLATAVAVVSETNGFALIENERQLASYSGLDVVQRKSGKMAKPTSISKRGNPRLRKALYMPALTSKRWNPQLKAFFEGLKARKLNGKMPLIAVMRKLLLLCYALWKKNQPFDLAYQQGKTVMITRPS
ncbi:IS110 family transposase [Hymenobacter norwichensis]|uniref:IS110 family transposase n=1 Tax=Hymenobacter norwichensis TaxID=223903 RepID=UPI0003B6FEE9|nr:IS110 family transposase [Hymenobacter norwichensis]